MKIKNIIAVLLAAAGSTSAVAADSRCEPQLYAEVELTVLPNGVVLMPATVKEQEVYFQLSVGSGLPMLLESSARSLGLEIRGRAGGATIVAGGQQVTRYAPLEGLKVGNFRMFPRAAPLMPQPETAVAPVLGGKVLLGIMGSDLFRNVDAEIFLAERRMKLFKPFRCLSRSPAYWEGTKAELPLRFDEAGTPIFTLELDGRKIETSLLGGDRVSTIDANAAQRFFGFDENSPGIEVVQQDNEERGLFHAMSLTGRDLSVQGARVRLREAGKCKLTESTIESRAIGYSDCISSVPFKLGTDLLSQLRIYISRTRSKIYISSVDQQASGEAGTMVIGREP